MYKGQRHYLLILSQYIGGRPQIKVFRGCSLTVGRKRGPILRFSLTFLWRKINCRDVWHKNYSFNFIANNTIIVIVLVWIALTSAAFAFPQFFFSFLFSRNGWPVFLWTMHLCTVHKSHQLHFLSTFSLKLSLTVLFTYLKIILLQYFQFSIFNFSKISSIQTDLIS